MNCKVDTAHKLQGRLCLPASKSYSIRAFIVAGCGGRSVIVGPSNCDDALVAKKIIECMGAAVSRRLGNQWIIDADKQKPRLKSLNVNESGTVLRLIIPLVANKGVDAKIDGEGTLRGRPNGFLIKALKTMGGHLSGTGPKQSIPIRIKSSQLKGGKIAIDGTLSSQFISALMMTCPLLKEDSELCLKGKKLVSTDYITMTLQILDEAGIRVRVTRDFRKIIIKGNQKYGGLRNFHVPSDYGLAAFSLAAAALVPSNLILEGYFNDKYVQADRYIMSFLKEMGVKFSQTSKDIRIKGPFQLRGGTFSLKNCPDLVPIMSVLALFADKKTELIDIEHVRTKESDRISDLRKELLKIGADVRETKSSLIINPKSEYLSDMVLDSHKDHRLAMAFTILGLKTPLTVKDMECTAKSYPDFVNDMRSIGANIRKN